MPESLRQLSTALRALLVLTLLLGIAYPLLVTGVGALAFPDRSRGSLIERDGAVVGSRLLGQVFEGDQWFLPRPSAGEYDGLASGGSNLGPNEPDLVASIDELRQDVAAREGVDPQSGATRRGHRLRLRPGPGHLPRLCRAAGAPGGRCSRSARGGRPCAGR